MQGHVPLQAAPGELLGQISLGPVYTLTTGPHLLQQDRVLSTRHHSCIGGKTASPTTQRSGVCLATFMLGCTWLRLWRKTDTFVTMPPITWCVTALPACLIIQAYFHLQLAPRAVQEHVLVRKLGASGLHAGVVCFIVCEFAAQNYLTQVRTQHKVPLKFPLVGSHLCHCGLMGQHLAVIFQLHPMLNAVCEQQFMHEARWLKH